MRTSPELEKKLQEYAQRGLIVPRKENNLYLKCSYKGAGNPISEKWNIKIYTSGSVVCNDLQTLDNISLPDKNLIAVQIDDAGIGFPLLGVMVGVHIEGTDSIWADVVPVEFFQNPLYEKKSYLDDYAKRGISLLKKYGVAPQTHRIEICTGYINKNLRDRLRDLGFDVRVTEIKGLLQSELEKLFSEYVRKTLKCDLAYDPKECEKSQLGQKYYSVLNWGKKFAPELLKTGWDSISKNMNRGS